MLFNSKNPLAILSVSIITLLLVGVWVISYSVTESKRKNEELEHNLSLWESNKPDFYRFKYSLGCMWVNHYVVNIDSHGTVTLPIDEAPVLQTVSIEQIFEDAREANTSAHKAETEYHPYFGFPVTILVDWNEEIIDDECFIQVSDFEVLTDSET